MEENSLSTLVVKDEMEELQNCHNCDNQFLTYDFEVHQLDCKGKDSESEINAKLKCDYCDLTSTRQSDLNKHILSVHNQMKNHECDACSMKFTTLQSMKKHITNAHNDKTKTIKYN